MSQFLWPKPWDPGANFASKKPMGHGNEIRRPMAPRQAAQDGLETATSEGRGPTTMSHYDWGDFAGIFFRQGKMDGRQT